MVLALMGGRGGEKGGEGWLARLCQMGRVVEDMRWFFRVGLERGCAIEREDLDQWFCRVGFGSWTWGIERGWCNLSYRNWLDSNGCRL